MKRGGVLAGLVLLAAQGAVLLSGCGQSRPRPFVPAPVHAESLQVALAAGSAPRGIAGRGSIGLEVGSRRQPTLDFRCAVRADGEGRALLRPGVLSPVLSIWTGAQGWSLLLPRQRVAFVSPADALPGRLAWYLLSPHELAVSLEKPRLLAREREWILTGKPAGLGDSIPAAEVWVDPQTLGISRWSLTLSNGESLLRVVCDPPISRPSRGSRLTILVPPLDCGGWLEFAAIEDSEVAPRPRPVIPDEWQTLSSEALPRYLEALLAEGD